MIPENYIEQWRSNAPWQTLVMIEQDFTRAMFEQSMALKKQHRDFQLDILSLLVPQIDWDFEEAVYMVEKQYIEKLAGQPWKNIKIDHY